MNGRTYNSAACYNAASLFNEYYDGELDNNQRAQLERHLRECPACAAEYEAFKNAIFLAKKSAYRPSNPVRLSVMEQINSGAVKMDAGTSRRRKRMPFGTMIALAAILVVVVVNRDAFGFIGKNINVLGDDPKYTSATEPALDETDRQTTKSGGATEQIVPGAYMIDPADAVILPTPLTADGLIDAEVTNDFGTSDEEHESQSEGEGATDGSSTSDVLSIDSALAQVDALPETITDDEEQSPAANDPSPEEQEIPEDEMPELSEQDIRIAMVGMADKIKNESGFSVPVCTTYMIAAAYDDSIQQTLLKDITHSEEKGIFIISKHDENKLIEHIYEHNDLSYYNYNEANGSVDIAIIFY